MPAHGLTTPSHGRLQSAAAVGFVTGGKGCLEVKAGGTNNGGGHTLPVYGCVCVVARAADFKDTAGLAHRDFGASLLLQVFDELFVHLSSRAKKADTFFKMSTSPLSYLFSSTSCLIRRCSAVSGLPMPLWPDCSTSNWPSHCLTALWPSFMSLQTWVMLRPWALTIWTTCSLKSVSNTLLDFGLLTVCAVSVLTTYQAVCFY